MKTSFFLVLLLASPGTAGAQTVINAVTDAASFAPRVAPGELASIFGSNLADSTQQAPGFPLPQTMSGATVFINNSPVPLLYVSETQINFQVPSTLAAGTARMYVTRDGGQSALFLFTVVASSPGIFQDSSNHAIAQNGTDNSTNSDNNPVASGAVIVAYLTGQGAVDHAVPDGTPTPTSPLSNSTATATATIGGMNATVQFLGLTPGFAGLAQANIVVPSKLAKADYPLVITVGGHVSASAMVSVSGSGTAPPTFLTLVGQLSFANDSASSIAVYQSTPYTYLCGPNRISIIHTGTASAPTYIGEFGDTDLAGNGGKCAINVNTSQPILVDIVGPATAPTFAVYSLTSPTSPVKLTQFPTSPYTFLTDISFLGTVGYFSTSWYQTSGNAISGQFGNFVAYDFSSFTPLLLSVLSTGPGSSGTSLMPNALALNSGTTYPNTAYIATTTSTGANTAGSAALDIVNITTPSSLQGVNQVTVADAAIFLGFGYDQNLLLVAGNTTGLQNPGFNITGNLTLSTLDITNVDAPVGIANLAPPNIPAIPTTGTYVVQPFKQGSNIFAIVNGPPSTDPLGPSSLMIVDASKPSAPALYPFVTQFGMTDVAAANGYLLVPNVNGLKIYSTQTP